MSTVSKPKRQELDELCVYGWIRENCINFEMPMDLQKLCILMYVIIMDVWNTEIHTKNVIIDKDDNIANVCRGRGWQHAFGTYIIKKGMIMSWKFKVDGKRGFGTKRNSKRRAIAIFIGIWEKDKISSNIESSYDGGFYNKPNGGYAFYTYQGAIKHKNVHNTVQYAEKCYDGDIIKMILDMTQKESENAVLSYEINDKSYGIAHDDIDIAKEYCLTVQISDSTDQSIQIIE